MDGKAIVTLVTGGARSGKSRFGESLLASHQSEILYIATAKIYDSEMNDRVEKHRMQRPASWHTIEEYRRFKQILPAWNNKVDGVLLDCITLMVTQLMLDKGTESWDHLTSVQLDEIEKSIQQEIDELITALRDMAVPVVIITNEVGLGIVPGDKLSRDFRDIAGRMNQRIASFADEVYLVVSGIPVQIK